MAIPLGAGEAEGKAEAEGEDADAAVVRVAELLPVRSADTAPKDAAVTDTELLRVADAENEPVRVPARVPVLVPLAGTADGERDRRGGREPGLDMVTLPLRLQDLEGLALPARDAPRECDRDGDLEAPTPSPGVAHGELLGDGPVPPPRPLSGVGEGDWDLLPAPL